MVVVGSINVDLVVSAERLPRPGETVTGGGFSRHLGGKGANQAVAAARAGASTRFLCALGDDAGAALARSLAQADGISLIEQRSPQPTGTAGIYVDAQGRNSIVIGPGANADLDARCIQAQRAAFEGARVVLAQCETPGEAVLAALELGRAAGAITLLNPAPANADVDAALLAAADIATPNETEFAALLSRHADEHVEANTVADLDDTTLHAFCRRLLPHGTVIVTLGAAGAFVSHGDDRRGDEAACLRIPAFPATAIDTTGAGDAFSGALAASLAQVDGPFAEHVRFAARYAARSTECAGAAVSMPRLTPASAEPDL